MDENTKFKSEFENELRELRDLQKEVQNALFQLTTIHRMLRIVKDIE